MENDPIDPLLLALRSQIGRFVEVLIANKWLANAVSPSVDVMRVDSDGGTDAITLKAAATIQFFVKHHPTAAQREFDGFSYLMQGPMAFHKHLIAPLATPADTRSNIIWVAPYLDASSLQRLVMRHVPDERYEWVIHLYRNVLQNMKQLWIDTRHPGTAPDIMQIYYQTRILERHDSFAKGFQTSRLDDLEIVVNEHSFGTYGELAARFSQRVSKAAKAMPRAACTVHGDEHANNILIKQSIAVMSPEAWYIVDYVNATPQGDWVFSLAKMLYWWRFQCVVEQAKKDNELRKRLKPDSKIEGQRLLLTYDRETLKASVPLLSHQLEREVQGLARGVCREFGETRRNMEARLQLAQVAAIWGSAANHFRRHAFAVPIMLGEALELL